MSVCFCITQALVINIWVIQPMYMYKGQPDALFHLGNPHNTGYLICIFYEKVLLLMFAVFLHLETLVVLKVTDSFRVSMHAYIHTLYMQVI